MIETTHNISYGWMVKDINIIKDIQTTKSKNAVLRKLAEKYSCEIYGTNLNTQIISVGESNLDARQIFTQNGAKGYIINESDDLKKAAILFWDSGEEKYIGRIDKEDFRNRQFNLTNHLF
ncbi:MAG: hypothetical protein IJR59_02645 [Firmicutes bacterium]|nr:hypothetical protein [Bacillota bacterium]